MDDAYSIELTARQEGLVYRTASTVYRFDVLLVDGDWQLFLPPSTGDDFAPHELSESEAAEMLPRIVNYLATDRLLGIPLRSRRVRLLTRE